MKTATFSPLTKAGRQGQTKQFPVNVDIFLGNVDYAVIAQVGFYGKERRAFSWQAAVQYFNQEK